MTHTQLPMNQQRALWSHAALDRYCREAHGAPAAELPRDELYIAAYDLVASLAHLADAIAIGAGEGGEDAFDRARWHYEIEVNDEGKTSWDDLQAALRERAESTLRIEHIRGH